MERGIEGMEWMASGPNPHDQGRQDVSRAGLPLWGGTGLCAEAQADGVPCTALGRECLTCWRASAERARPQDTTVSPDSGPRRGRR